MSLITTHDIPFDLETKIISGPKYEDFSKFYSDTDIKELINGYVPIKCDKFPLVKSGTHARYLRKDGLFRRGGFISKNPIETKPDSYGKTRKLFLFRSGVGTRGGINWMVNYDDIETMWIKIGLEFDLFVKPEIDKLLSHIHTLFQQVTRLTEDTNKLKLMYKKIKNGNNNNWETSSTTSSMC